MKCPFCDTSVKNAVFVESENFMALYNLAPILPGHSLILPKEHKETLLELTDDELTEMMVFSRKVTKLLLHVFNAEAFGWSVQDQEAAGQTISHLHLHIVPRITGDMESPGDWYPKIQNSYKEVLDSVKRSKLNDAEIKTVVEKLKEAASMHKF